MHDATQTDSVTPMICQNNRKLEARAVVKYLILRGGVGGDEAHKNAQKMKPVCPDFCSSYASVQYWSGSAYNEENATSLKKTISTNDCERFS